MSRRAVAVRRGRPGPRWTVRRDRGRLVADVRAADLGVHDRDGADDRCYVDRTADAALGAAVGADPAGTVVACGPRLAGTTRALARAARLLLGDHLLVTATPTDAAGLDDARTRAAAVHAADRAGRPVVLWIDDAPLSLLVDPVAAAALTGPDGDRGDGTVRILVTAREEWLHPDLAPAAAPSRSRPVVLAGPLDDDEAATARCRGIDWAPGDVVGRRVLDLAGAREVLRPAGGIGAIRTAAVLRAAADWDRLGVPGPLSRSMLGHLAVAYAEDLDPRGRRHGPEHLLSAVDALAGRRSPWLCRVRREDALHHAVDPRLVAAADDLVGASGGWDSPARLDDTLDDRITDPALRRAIGILALRRHLDGVALRLLAGADPTDVGSRTSYGIGLAALGRADHPEARRWFGAVAEGDEQAGPTREAYRCRAAFWLGLDPSASLDERREHLSVVVGEGPPCDAADAAYMLAALEREDGRLEDRRRWLDVAARRAEDAGDGHRRADALVELGHLEWSTGSLDAARTAFTAVVDGGDDECVPEAMMALGTLAAEDGDDPGAQEWYRQAAAGWPVPAVADVPHQRHEEPELRSHVEA